MRFRLLITAGLLLLAAGSPALLTAARAQEARQAAGQAALPGAASRVVTTAAALPGMSSSPEGQHPLTPVLKFARAEQAYLASSVRSFTCRLVKRERIEGNLQEHQYIDLSCQEAGQGTPMKVLLDYVAPEEVAGRRVLFVEGENEGKMVVRKGGKGRIGNLVIKINPTSEAAQRESLLPVTEIGFHRMMAHQIDLLQSHLQADRSGTNSQVQHVRGAKVNGRTCDVIRVSHPRQSSGLEFHRAEVFIDRDLHVPTRIVAFDWPTTSDPAPVIAEFTYTDLKVNVEFPAETFDAAAIRK
jgi:hypothetical protein